MGRLAGVEAAGVGRFQQRTREVAVTEPIPAANRVTWRVGQRVSRKDTEELGTVVEIDGSIKVKWDDGSTSYFRHGDPGSIQLKQPQRE
jgi:hypothetical protein